MERAESVAGPDPEGANYYPGDEEFLLGFEFGVEQYEVATGPQV